MVTKTTRLQEVINHLYDQNIGDIEGARVTSKSARRCAAIVEARNVLFYLRDTATLTGEQRAAIVDALR